MRVVDAGVDHGDLDPLAVEAGQAIPHAGGADQRHTADVVRLHQLDRPDRRDAGQFGEFAELAAVDPHLDAVVGDLVVGQDGAAELGDPAPETVLRRLQLRLDPLLL